MDAKLAVRSLLPLGYFPLEADLTFDRDFQSNAAASQTTTDTVVDMEHEHH